MFGFIIGLFVGAFIGVAIMCLFNAPSVADNENGKRRNDKNDGKND